MRQLRKMPESAIALRQKGFILVGTDGTIATMKNAYGVVVKAADNLARYCSRVAVEQKKVVPSSWKQGQTVTVCSKQVIPVSRDWIPEIMLHKRKPEKYNPNKRKEHRDRTRIIERLADA